MEETKDCEIVLLNKFTHKFALKDLHKALKWGSENGGIWAISTPYGVLQPMDEEAFENVSACMFEGDSTTPDNACEDLVV